MTKDSLTKIAHKSESVSYGKRPNVSLRIHQTQQTSHF